MALTRRIITALPIIMVFSDEWYSIFNDSLAKTMHCMDSTYLRTAAAAVSA